jgi:hypothetical protein
MATESNDRRATLEAAFDAAEQAATTEEAVTTATAESTATEDAASTQKEAVATEQPSDGETAVETEKVATAKPEEDVVEKPVNVDRAPQAWKPAQKAKWETLDPDVRQEVLRREHETTRVLSDSAQARQFTTQVHQAMQPYMARIQQIGNPVQAIQNLLAADHLLATGGAAQKAQYLAKLITDYGVDINALDSALAGAPIADPVQSRVETMLQQRLAPFEQYLTAQQQREQQAQQNATRQVLMTVEQMAQDTKNYPYFEDVRDTMADIAEIMDRKGMSIDLKTAYNRAVAMDPVISQVAAQASAKQAQAAQAAQANAKAQRALNASSSVRGAPTGPLNGKPPKDRRAMIEAAFDEVGGR